MPDSDYLAGHSEWSNIKRRKGAQDAKRGKLFTKLIKETTVVTREGGSDLNDAAFKDAMKLVYAMEDDVGIQKVYHNIDVTEEQLNTL